MLEITSNNNHLIKSIKGLTRKKNRWNQKLFIIEGKKMIIEAVENNAPMVHLVVSESFIEKNHEFIYKELSSFRNVIKVTDSIFSQVTILENSDGILATIDLSIVNNELDKGIYIYLDGIQDPGNLGTIIRSCDAFNLSGIILGQGSVDPFSPKVVRASMGSIFRTKLFFMDREELLEKKKAGYRLISTAIEDSLELDKLSFTNKDIIIIGNEGSGISSFLLDNSDIKVTIPMKGKAESLNAGVAASIIMYAASRM